MTATTNAASLQHAIGLNGRFALRLPSGHVVVRAVDGEIARVRDLDGRSLAERFNIDMGEGSLSLRAPEGGVNFVLDLGFLRRSQRANLEIELPRLATVQLETASADVRAYGLQGQGQYRTASGELTLTAAGGSIDIEAVSGDVLVRADAEVSVGCRTVSGDVRVEATTLTRFQVATTSGDIRAVGSLAGDGPFSINTVSGKAEIVTESGLRVEAKTVAGDIRSPERRKPDSGRGRHAFSVGSGQTPLSFRSISGDLRIMNRGDRDDLADLDLDDVTFDASKATVPPVPPVPPMTPVPPAAPVAALAPEDDRVADRRLEILRALERGEISVEDATINLADLDGGAV